MFNNFAPFNLPNDDTRVSRNFDELITERGENSFFSDKIYQSVFDKIQQKLFICSELDDVHLTEADEALYSFKYDISEKQESINTLKQDIAKMYIKKTEHEILIQERKKLFETFCTNIRASISSIQAISDNCENDTNLSNLLNERIEWYYNKLELDKLVDIDYQIKSEFYFLKKTIKELSGINSVVLCSICMENQIAWFIDPCGHTLCEGCKIKTNSAHNCHYCRTLRTKFNRLYI